MDGPIPLHRYRAFKKSKADERADRIEQLARQLGLPIAALAGEQGVTLVTVDNASEPRKQPFAPAPAYCYPTPIAAKLAIADELARPLAKLPLEDRQFIDQILKETLERKIVLTRVRDYFRAKPTLGGEQEQAG